MNVTLHDGYVPGCIGQITELHARYYHDQAGFGIEFESKVASEWQPLGRRSHAAALRTGGLTEYRHLE